MKIAERLESAKIDVKDVADELESCLDDLSFDDYSLEKVEKNALKKSKASREKIRRHDGSRERVFLRKMPRKNTTFFNQCGRARDKT
ncbi:MAG: hypothetical protein L6V79_05175 [Clostridium sp.]|nr:MAG: hypothetical protein L6V79_05175 [Clostridium sp.]